MTSPATTTKRDGVSGRTRRTVALLTESLSKRLRFPTQGVRVKVHKVREVAHTWTVTRKKMPPFKM